MSDQASLGLYISLWVMLFQLVIGLGLMLVKRTLKQIFAASNRRKGIHRCDEFIHVHCSKMTHEEGVHVDEEHLAVWKN